MTDEIGAARHETARRFAEQISDHYDVDMQVKWSPSDIGDVWTVTWTDGPAPDGAVVDVAKAIAQSLGGVRGRLQVRRALSPWAWLWAFRNAQAGGVLPRSADQAVDIIGAELVRAEIPMPTAPPEVHLAELTLEEAPPLALAEFVITQATAGGHGDVDETPPADRAAASGGADTSRDSGRGHSPVRPETRDGSAGGDSRPSLSGGAGGRPETRDESGASGAGGNAGIRPETSDGTPACAHCGNALPPRAETGRVARFCTTRCRQAAHRASQRDPASTTQRHCERCEKPLEVAPRPGRQRRWCSDACRAAASRARLRDTQSSA